MGGQGKKDPPDPPDKNKKTPDSYSSSTNTLTEDGMVNGAVGGMGGGEVGGAVGGEEGRAFGGTRPKTLEEEDDLYDNIWDSDNSTSMNLDKDQNRREKPVTKAKGQDGKEDLKRRYAEIIANAEEVARGRQSIILKLNKIQDIDNSDNTVPNLSHEEIGDLIFDTLKIKPDDILGINLYTGRYDTRELIIKANADVSSLVNRKIEFKDIWSKY